MYLLSLFYFKISLDVFLSIWVTAFLPFQHVSAQTCSNLNNLLISGDTQKGNHNVEQIVPERLGAKMAQKIEIK